MNAKIAEAQTMTAIRNRRVAVGGNAASSHLLNVRLLHTIAFGWPPSERDTRRAQIIYLALLTCSCRAYFLKRTARTEIYMIRRGAAPLMTCNSALRMQQQITVLSETGSALNSKANSWAPRSKRWRSRFDVRQIIGRNVAVRLDGPQRWLRHCN